MNSINYIDLSTKERSEDNKGIALDRMICSFISIGSCVGIIIIYFTLCIQVCLKKKRSGKQQGLQINNSIESQDKIGLGSHFMFFLILSNFLESFVPIIFYIYYKDYVAEKGDPLCTTLGFFHNFLDLCAICWTLVIVQLFKTSTQITEFAPGQEKKFFIFACLYSILVPLVFTLSPFLLNLISGKYVYGDADTHCSFYYKDASWITVTFSAFVFLNIAYIVFLLWKVRKYYTKKLNLLEKGSEDYQVFRIYVLVFKIFPFILIISRVLKGFSRGIQYYVSLLFNFNLPQNILLTVNYIAATLFCLNGLFNSLVCIYFFRSVFQCKNDREKGLSTSLVTIRDEEEDNGLGLVRPSIVQHELGDDSIDIED